MKELLSKGWGVGVGLGHSFKECSIKTSLLSNQNLGWSPPILAVLNRDSSTLHSSRLRTVSKNRERIDGFPKLSSCIHKKP